MPNPHQHRVEIEGGHVIDIDEILKNDMTFGINANQPVNQSKDQKLAAILRKRHPESEFMLGLWDTYKIFYEGVGVSDFIHKHLRESPQSLRERKKRGYYLNYVEQVVNIYSGFLYRQPIKRKIEIKGDKDSESIFEEIEKDFDRSGTTIDDFFKEIAIWNLVYGTQFILIDMPDDDSSSLKEQKEARDYPFAIRLNPHRVINWALDDKNDLLWIRIQEPPPPIDDPLSPKIVDNTVEEEFYTTWTRNQWIRHKISVTRDANNNSKKTTVQVVGKGNHDLGLVPVICVKSREYSRTPLLGLSFVHDITFTSIALLNVCSLLDEEMYQKALTLLAVKRSADDVPTIELGSNNAIEYTGDDPPMFLSPSLAPGEFFLSIIEAMSKEIFRMAKLSGGVAVLEEAMSGIAHAYLFNETNQSLSDQADNLEKAEKKVLKVMATWMEVQDKAQISVSYPDDFGIINVEEELKVLKELRNTIPSNKLYTALAQDVAQVLLQGKSEKDITKEIMDEIAKGVEEEAKLRAKMLEQQPPQFDPNKKPVPPKEPLNKSGQGSSKEVEEKEV